MIILVSSRVARSPDRETSTTMDGQRLTREDIDNAQRPDPTAIA
jgi:hypothetical protein